MRTQKPEDRWGSDPLHARPVPTSPIVQLSLCIPRGVSGLLTKGVQKGRPGTQMLVDGAVRLQCCKQPTRVTKKLIVVFFFTHSCGSIPLLWGDTMNNATLIKRKHLIWSSLFQKIVESVTITVGRKQAWCWSHNWKAYILIFRQQVTPRGWSWLSNWSFKAHPNGTPAPTSPHPQTLSKQIHKVEWSP